MKTKSAIWMAVLVTLSLMTAYWLGHQQGSRPGVVSLNIPGKSKQVGLSFLQGHNDLSRIPSSMVYPGGILVPPRKEPTGFQRGRDWADLSSRSAGADARAA